MEMGIDRIIYLKPISTGNPSDDFKFPFKYTIQERFRHRFSKPKPDKWTHQLRRYDYTQNLDLTITERNLLSGEKSEAHKIESGFFVYSYFDEERELFLHPIMVNVPDLIDHLARKSFYYPEVSYRKGYPIEQKQSDTIYYTRIRPTEEKQQVVIAIKFDELERVGVVRFHEKQIGGMFK
jgi:hypothetical protein